MILQYMNFAQMAIINKQVFAQKAPKSSKTFKWCHAINNKCVFKACLKACCDRANVLNVDGFYASWRKFAFQPQAMLQNVTGVNTLQVLLRLHAIHAMRSNCGHIILRYE